MNRFTHILLCLLILLPTATTAQHEVPELAGRHLKIGVLAFRGDTRAQKVWGPTVEYLSLAVPGVTFTLLPLDLEQMAQAVENGEVSFIITNPGNYVEHEYRYGVTRIATLQRFHDHSPSQRIHSAIIVRANRPDLTRISDLKGKSVMAVGENAFGGFQVAWGAMKTEGIDPYRDFSRLEFAGFPQDNIVKAVLSGTIDAGIVRGCLLEQMEKAGSIQMSEFHVLGGRLNDIGDCQVSTPAYPDWPLAKLGGTSDYLAKRVTMTLLAMPDYHQAARAGGYSGWTIPVQYQSVHELFRELQIGPYRWMRQTPLRLLWSRYWQWFLLAGMGILWWFWHVYRVEQRVRTRTLQLSQANRRLTEEMEERKQTEQKLLIQQNELAHVARVSTAGELASGLAHEINQPLSAISSYAQGCVWRLESGRISNEELLDITQRIASEAERAGAIIQRLRDFLRKGPASCRRIDLNQTVREAVSLFAAEARGRSIEVDMDLQENLPAVCSETIQVQQVIINLMRNAAEAMKELPPEHARIELRSYSDDDNQQVHISVRDFGKGIDPESRKHLFEPFYSTSIDGMGLGLSLSQSIVESHGGRIRVVEDIHPGACLDITLPIDQRNPQNE